MIDLQAVQRLMSPKQIASFNHATAFFSLWTGAVRSGKTYISLLRFLNDVLNAPQQGSIAVIAKTGQTADRNIFDPLRTNFGPFIGSNVHFTPGAHTATLFGRKVHVVGAHDARSEDRIRGATLSLAYVDELSLVSEEFFNMLTSRLTVPGAKILATTNPDNPRHWLRVNWILRQNDPDVEMRHWHFIIDDNPSLGPREINRLKRMYPPGMWYNRFILGQWVAGEGAIYDMFDEAQHVIGTFPSAISDLWVAGIDYGTANPLHAVLLGLGTDDVFYVTSEWRWDSRKERRQLTDAEYSVKIREWLNGCRFPRMRLTGIEPKFVCVDPSAASFREQLWRDGLQPVEGDNSVLDGIRSVAALFGMGKLRIHRSCEHLVDEIHGYVWDEKKAQLGEDVPVKLDDHGVDALRYGLHTTRGIWAPRIGMRGLAA